MPGCLDASPVVLNLAVYFLQWPRVRWDKAESLRVARCGGNQRLSELSRENYLAGLPLAAMLIRVSLFAALGGFLYG